MSPFTAFIQFPIDSLVHYYNSLPAASPLPSPNSSYSLSALSLKYSNSVTFPLRRLQGYLDKGVKSKLLNPT